MLRDLNIEQTRLMAYMSGISEKCFSSGWMANLEYSLWNAVINGPKRYGRGMISQEDIEYLKYESAVCNSWVVFDDINEETAIDLALWRKKYDQDILQNPHLLDY